MEGSAGSAGRGPGSAGGDAAPPGRRSRGRAPSELRLRHLPPPAPCRPAGPRVASSARAGPPELQVRAASVRGRPSAPARRRLRPAYLRLQVSSAARPAPRSPRPPRQGPPPGRVAGSASPPGRAGWLPGDLLWAPTRGRSAQHRTWCGQPHVARRPRQVSGAPVTG